MRAFMSGPNEFGTANDYIRHCAAEEECPALRYNASATEAWTSAKQRIAEREARAILAETEPIPEGYSQADRVHRITVSEIAAGAFTGDGFPALWNAERALAESLAAFLEQEF